MPLGPGLSLVTGATGFVGAAVARALRAAGSPVRVLARPQSDRRNLAGHRVDWHESCLRALKAHLHFHRDVEYVIDQGEVVTIPSLADKADWDKYEGARRAMSGKLSSAVPAPRYHVGESAST